MTESFTNSEVVNYFCQIADVSQRGAETLGFHESPSIPKFLYLGRVSHESQEY